jgi:hypothetical protein
MMSAMILSPGPTPTTFRSPTGQLLSPPADWSCLPPGDPGLTRRVKAAGPHWVVQEKVGRKIFSRGVWAPAATIESIRRQLATERATPAHAKRQAAARERRDRDQTDYVQSFHQAVLTFLDFHPRHADLARRLAAAITSHATPVGSQTVARTRRISIEDRAQAATIAWLRHQTTTYDHMKIPRIKGKRREVRRLLAQQSNNLLQRYREARDVDPAASPLHRALAQL